MVRFVPRLFVLGFFLLPATPLHAQDKNALTRKDVDERISAAITETVTTGATIFNAGDQAGCFRLYQGALTTIAALLDHRPDLQKKVTRGIASAQKLRVPSDRAFALRSLLDEIQETVRKEGAAARSLWDRLGGEPAVQAVVHDFVVRAAGNPKVNFDRGGKYKLDAKGVAHLEQLLVELVSAASGGPLKYTGRDMKSTHAGMAITDGEFDALAGDLIAVLKKYKVPQKEIDELVGIVAATRKEIVEAGATPAAKKSLYERLGGAPAITAVVDDFVARAAGNPKVNFARKGTPAEWQATPDNVAHLKKMLIDLVGAATGGPQKYEGRSMKEAHQGMAITAAEFNALAGDLKATLDKFKVPAAEQAELFKIIEATRGDIVEKK